MAPLGVFVGEGEGVGVAGTGVPAHIVTPCIAGTGAGGGDEVLPPPPQLSSNAAARNESTGTITRHLRHQSIEH
ncbi:MAG: hypothetical protein ACREQN_00740 [Candidatus Binataceae bacterium]